ncbi:hypothetical protein [Nitriliruptor alkaliphilus]|uniref:hypothetical protein n=1 Tax=Nitriliruptor alkaliphilus TaxID=427918 RepID=UPI0012EECB07|nr:hypothetical protein [Nitriliruptor alkaliphilus]
MAGMPRGLALVLVVALVAGCTTGGDDGPADDGPAADVDAAEPAEPDELRPNGRLVLTGWQEHHLGSQVSVALRGVEVDAAGFLTVDIESVNANFRGAGMVSLADPHVWVVDDLGNEHPMVRPAVDERLRFPKDHRLSGVLAFEEPLAAEARTFTLMFNQRPGDQLISASEHDPSVSPKFLFEGVPLPGVGLEVEADRGEAGQLTDRAVAEVGETYTPDHLPEVEVTVHRVVGDGRTVSIEFDVRNGSSRQILLAGSLPWLDDGHGSTFVTVEQDRDNTEVAERRVELEPGDEATVTLSWRGVVAADADTLTLTLNTGTRDENSGLAPYLRIDDLPVPGR